jgi:hypothetical protein
MSVKGNGFTVINQIDLAIAKSSSTRVFTSGVSAVGEGPAQLHLICQLDKLPGVELLLASLSSTP